MSSWQNKTVKSWEDEKLLSVPGGVLIKTTLLKSLAKALLYTQAVFLSKQVWTDNHGWSKFLHLAFPCILLGSRFNTASIWNNECWSKETSNMVGAFLWKYVSIPRMGLILIFLILLNFFSSSERVHVGLIQGHRKKSRKYGISQMWQHQFQFMTNCFLGVRSAIITSISLLTKQACDLAMMSQHNFDLSMWSPPCNVPFGHEMLGYTLLFWALRD